MLVKFIDQDSERISQAAMLQIDLSIIPRIGEYVTFYNGESGQRETLPRCVMFVNHDLAMNFIEIGVSASVLPWKPLVQKEISCVPSKKSLKDWIGDMIRRASP